MTSHPIPDCGGPEGLQDGRFGVAADRAVMPSAPSPAVSAVPASIPSAFAGHRLCYVEGSWAYFTNTPLDKQWGDDWDDAPYEHNAGAPYARDPGQIFRVAWDGPFERPGAYETNSRWSVQQINAGAVAWLLPSWSGIKSFVPAGATLAEFVATLHAEKGEVYFPASAIEARSDETRSGSAEGESAVPQADAQSPAQGDTQ